MELNGALSNPFQRDKGLLLNVSKLYHTALARPMTSPRAPSTAKRNDARAVRAALTEVLSEAGSDLRLSAIHERVEQRLDSTLSRDPLQGLRQRPVERRASLARASRLRPLPPSLRILARLAPRGPSHMVRRGSTVRVRQRASSKAPQKRGFCLLSMQRKDPKGGLCQQSVSSVRRLGQDRPCPRGQPDRPQALMGFAKRG